MCQLSLRSLCMQRNGKVCGGSWEWVGWRRVQSIVEPPLAAPTLDQELRVGSAYAQTFCHLDAA